MSKRDVADLACRILALWLLIINAHYIILLPVAFGGGLVDFLWYREFSTIAFGLMCSGVSIILLLWFIWFLWSRSYWIAAQLIPENANYGRWTHIRVLDLQTAAFSVVGLVALLNAVHSFSQSLGHYIDARRMGGTYAGLIDWLGMPETLAAIANSALGLWLILGSRGIVKMIRKLRGMGTPSEEGDAIEEPSRSDAAQGES
jgi:hypothetical protein